MPLSLLTNVTGAGDELEHISTNLICTTHVAHNTLSGSWCSGDVVIKGNIVVVNRLSALDFKPSKNHRKLISKWNRFILNPPGSRAPSKAKYGRFFGEEI